MRVVISFALGVFISCSAVATDINEVIREQFVPYAKKAFREWNIPGMAIAIVHNGRVAYIDAYGIKDVKTKEKVDPNTLFRIASLSKGFTSSLILRLAKEGRLDIEDRVASHLPYGSLKDNKFPRELNIKHVLSHSTGFTPHALVGELEGKQAYSKLIAKISTLKPVCKLGKCFSYQNFIYNLAGDIAVRATNHKNFDSVMKSYIFHPLGMYNSSADSHTYLKSSNKALPHLSAGKNKFLLSEKDIISPYYNVPAAGGINSSINDMAKWLLAQMGYAPQVLDNSILRKIHTPVIKDTKACQSLWSQKRLKERYYGLGWRVHKYHNEKMVFHGGLVKGFSSMIGFLPNQDVGIVVLSNSNTPLPGMLMAKFFDLYLKLPNLDYSGIELKSRLKYHAVSTVKKIKKQLPIKKKKSRAA